MKDAVYLIAAARTGVAPQQGKLKHLQVHELATPVLRRCLRDAGLAYEQVDEVIIGNALYGGGNPARLAALSAGLPARVGGLTIDRQCCSGLDAILLAAQMIRGGAANAILAGGAESHSRRPVRSHVDIRTGKATPYERPPFSPWPDRDPDLHLAAARLAASRKISQQQQDRWAIDSHGRAINAAGRLELEIEKTGDSDLGRDTFTRALNAKLCRRAHVLNGSITAANTAVSADGAAFALLVSANLWRELQRPYALRLGDGAALGGDPESPATAPVAAINQVLTANKLMPKALSCAEIMEAYAVQCMVCVRDSGLEDTAVNVGGGALARGHPIGASGAILAVRLFYELRNRGGLGLAAIAAAGGLGTAVLFETV